MKKQYLDKIAEAYYKLLLKIDWEDPIFMNGIREGLNKFLSNAYLKSYPTHKYLKGDFYSTNAKKQIESGNVKGLIFEHMVPKSEYIQKPCEKIAEKKDEQLTIDFIKDLLYKYWWIAIVTKEENALLMKNKMPSDWDQANIHARYDAEKIELIPVKNVLFP